MGVARWCLTAIGTAPDEDVARRLSDRLRAIMCSEQYGCVSATLDVQTHDDLTERAGFAIDETEKRAR